MTGAEALALHLAAQELLRQQAAAMVSEEVELAEALSQDISGLLDQLPDGLDEVDDSMRAQLVEAARSTARELANGLTTLDALRRHHIEQHARAERDGAALRHYQPMSGCAPAHYLDERR